VVISQLLIAVCYRDGILLTSLLKGGHYVFSTTLCVYTPGLTKIDGSYYWL
jgi:hypothetical protein